LDVFLGKNYLVTHHDKQIEPLERIWSAIKHDQRFYKNGVDRLLYRLADEVVGSYMPVVEALDKAIDDAEDQVFSNPTSRTLEKIFSLKRDVLHLRRVIGPQREVLNRLARDDYAVVEVRTRVYFRDVYDHLVRMHDITETVRDLVSGALDTYLSVINNRMNDIMKTLTVITTLFMPISFLTGFFGMNFFVAVPPYSAFTTTPVLVAVLLMVVLVPFSMFAWIRRRGWM
jgi:magnesium transporter